MSDESDFIDINAEIKVFEKILKEDGYKEEKKMKDNTQETIQELAQDGKKITEKKIENSLNYDILSNEEKQLIDKINQDITIDDSTSVLQYGMEAQTKIAKFSDNVLEGVKNKSTGEVGDILTDLVAEIKSFDSNVTESNNKFLNFFRGTKKQLIKLIAKYNTIENNIDKIEENLDKHRIQMLKDIIIFDEMYEKNLEYFKDISLYIIAGDKKIEELNAQLKELKEKAIQTKEQLDAQKVNDMENMINRFEKKIHDLKMTRIISIQMAPQIRLLQNNEAELTEKIQSSLTNTIPLWKNQIVLALGISNSKQALDAQHALSNATNELLQKNSELLKQGSIEVAQESERAIIDIQTLNKTNQNILETLDQVIKIHSDGRQKRLEAEKELIVIEEDLKQKLYEIQVKSNKN